MRYQEIAPSADLRLFVKCYWQLEGVLDRLENERIVPDGRMDMVFHFGDPFERMGDSPLLQKKCVIAGQLTRPIEIRPTGSKIGIFAIRFRSQGFTAIFEEPSDMLRDREINLEDIHPSGCLELEERVRSSRTWTERVTWIERFLRSRVARSRVFDRHIRTAAQLFYENPTEDRILQLAGEFGISLRQFERTFKSQVGMSPSQFIRIARFQAALRTKLINPQLSFTTLAVECGYYDQAHFSREFKELSGMSPRSYFGAQHEMADLFSQ